MLEEKLIDLKNMKYIGCVDFTHSDTSGEEIISFYYDDKNTLYHEIQFFDPFDYTTSIKTTRCVLDAEEVKRLVNLKKVNDYRRFYWDA